MLINCYHCHIIFNKKPSEMSKTNFCSRACMSAARRANPEINANYRGGKEFPCLNCEKPVYIAPWKQKNESNYFCSKTCHGIWISHNLVGEAATAFKNKKHRSRCEVCELEMEYFGTKKYCSKACSAIGQKKINLFDCVRCQKQFVRCDSEIFWNIQRGHKPKFCSKECQFAFQRGPEHHNWVEDRSKIKSIERSLRYSAAMKEWRTFVFVRDKYECVACGDKSVKGHAVTLNAHHIKRFCDFEDLRFDPNNGVTLCVACHDIVTGKEADYEEFFHEIVMNQNSLSNNPNNLPRKALRDLINKSKEAMTAFNKVGHHESSEVLAI